MKHFKSVSQKTIAALTLVSVYIICSAHFIWMEAPVVTTIGKETNIKLFYGEIADNQIEQAGEKLEEVNGLKTVSIDPKNQLKELDLTKQTDGFTTKITPEESGVYQILTTNNVREVVDWNKYDLGIVRLIYYSRIHLLALSKKTEAEKQSSDIKPYWDLDILPDLAEAKSNVFHLNQPIGLTAFFKRNPLSKAKLFVYAPNGWMKEVATDDKGKASYTALWPGQYVVECIYEEKIPGVFKDKSYEAIRHRSVLTLTVK